MKSDIYQTVTDRIIRDLEKGVRPWHQPWSAAHTDGRIVLPRRHNGVAYRGVNILTLWMAALDKGYRSAIWMTFKQALNLGGFVRKAERNARATQLALFEVHEDRRPASERTAAGRYTEPGPLDWLP